MDRPNEKRTRAVKVMLTDSELLELIEQADAKDMDRAEILRRAWLQFTWGTVGLARLRAKRYRGSDEELCRTDFEDSALHGGVPSK